VLGLAGVTTCVFVSYLRSVSVVRRAVVLALIALAVSACGGSRHVAFSRFTTVGELSVPTPPGFHHRSWPGGGHGQQRSDKRKRIQVSGGGLSPARPKPGHPHRLPTQRNVSRHARATHSPPAGVRPASPWRRCLGRRGAPRRCLRLPDEGCRVQDAGLRRSGMARSKRPRG